MGVTHHLLVASPLEAQAIAAHEDPSRDWDGFYCRGLDGIKLVAMWSLVETGSTDNEFERRMDSVMTVSTDENGPCVQVAPPSMVSALASIAALDEEEVRPLAAALVSMEDFEGWDEDEVIDLVRSVGDQAETASLAGKTLVLYTSL
jgi:hypothetical protein